MQDKVDLIYKMMRYLGLSIDDLIVFDRSIDLTGKFPLEVYFSDKTRSFDVKHSFDSDDRTPIGIIIDNTVFTLGNYHNLLFASEIDDFCKSLFDNEKVSLPTVEQAKKLSEHLNEYNKISLFFQNGRLERDCIAVSSAQSLDFVQSYYNLKDGTVCVTEKCIHTIGVINL